MNTILSNMDMKPSVLVVDDEKRIRDACTTLLTEEGIEVAVAENGDLGLTMIEQSHYDIILLDLMMPGLSGLEVLPRVKSLHPDTVIIVITGYATIEHAIEAMKKGAFDFIPKPFSPQDLRLIIAKATEYVRSLQDIATEKSRMRVLINHLADGVMATDRNKRVVLANPSFLKFSGNTGKKVIGTKVDAFVACPEVIEMIDDILAIEDATNRECVAEICNQTCNVPDQTQSVFSARCVPFKDRLNRNLGTITVLNDITASKQMDQLKSQFVSTVSHEIQSPLNSVMMQLKIIADELVGPVTAKQKEMLLRAINKIETLSSLSAELLDLARIESGCIDQERETLPIPAIVADQIRFYQEKADSADVRLEVDIPNPDTLPPVWGNRRNIEEIISNLISNAIRYTPGGGDVTVSLFRSDAFICLKVKDTGIGMSTDEQEHIFERFYRVKNEKTRYINGTGLGLAIVKSIVDAHSGHIEIESSPGQGSCFSVYLPVGE